MTRPIANPLEKFREIGRLAPPKFLAKRIVDQSRAQGLILQHFQFKRAIQMTSPVNGNDASSRSHDSTMVNWRRTYASSTRDITKEFLKGRSNCDRVEIAVFGCN